MQNSTRISVRQTSLFGETASTFSREASPASRSARQANDEVRRTIAISGLRCCERYGKSVPAGSWARMFSESLVGRKDWYSSRCALIWKLKVTASSRMYFQLAVSMHRTGDFVAHLADGSDARSENMQKRTDGAATVEFTADTDSQRRTRRDTKSGGTDSNAAFRTNFFGLLERPGRERSAADTSRFESTGRRPSILFARSAGIAGSECAPDAQSGRFAQRDAKSHISVLYAATRRHDSIPDWADFPAQSPVRGGDDGLSERLDPAAVFAGIDERQHRRRSHVVRWYTEAIKCYGNAIVPQVAYRILMTIYRYESRIAE